MPIDYTKHVYGEIFGFLQEHGYRVGQGENVRFSGFDLETMLGLVRSGTGADSVGKQYNTFLQYMTALESVGYESVSFNQFFGNAKKGHVRGKRGEFRVRYARDPRELMAEAGISKEQIKKGREDVLRLLYHTPGEPWDIGKAGKTRDRYLSKLATLSEKEAGALISSLYGKGMKGMAFVVGHNVQFDTTMARGVAQGLTSSRTKFIDSLHIAEEIFPELGRASARPGAYKLENIRSAMEYIHSLTGADVKVSQAVINSHLQQDVGKLKYLPPERFYSADVLKMVPELGEAYAWIGETYGFEKLGAAHRSPLTDVIFSNALLKAALIRASKETTQGEIARERLANYFRSIGVLEGATLQKTIRYQTKMDPQNVVHIMNMVPLKRKETFLSALQAKGKIVLEDARIYGKRAFKDLYHQISTDFGDDMARQLRVTTQLLSKRMKKPTFMLRKTEFGWTDLIFGEGEVAESYVGLPLQSASDTEKGIFHIRGKAKEAASTGYFKGKQLKVQTYVTHFYKRLRALAEKYWLSAENVDKSLYNLIDLVHGTELPKMSGQKVMTMRKGSEEEIVEATIGNLRGSSVFHQGRLGTEIALKKGGIIQLIGESDLAKAKQSVDAAIKNIYKKVGSGDPKAVRNAFAEYKAAHAEVAEAINRRPGLAQAYALTKPDWYANRGLMRLGTASFNELFSPIPQASAYHKGRFSGITSARDLRPQQVRHLMSLGERVGPALLTAGGFRETQSKGIFSERLFMNSVEAGTIFVDVGKKNRKLIERSIFGDAGILGTSYGMELFKDQQFAQTIRIEHPPTHILGELRTLFSSEKFDAAGFNIADAESYVTVKGQGLRGKLSGSQTQALKNLKAMTKMTKGKQLWNQLAAGRVGVASMGVGDELTLTLYSTEAAVPRFENILMTPGDTRLMAKSIPGRVGQGISRGLARVGPFGLKTHFIAPLDALKSTNAALETLLLHRVSLARRYGLDKDMRNFFNKLPDMADVDGVFALKESRTGLKTLVMPDQIDKEAVFNYMDKWHEHLQKRVNQYKRDYRNDRAIKLSHKQKAHIAFVEGYSGVAVSKEQRAMMARTFRTSVPEARMLLTDVRMRFTSQDISRSILEGVKFTPSHIQNIMQGGPAGDPIARMLNRELKKQTGFYFKGGVLQAPEQVEAFLKGFLKPQGPKALVLEPSEGLYKVARAPKGYTGPERFTVPGTSYIGGDPLSVLKGTIFDPEITGKYNVSVKLPQAFPVETTGGTAHLRYLPVPPSVVTNIPTYKEGAERLFQYTEKDIAGTLARGFGTLAGAGDLGEVGGGKGLLKFVKPVSKMTRWVGGPGGPEGKWAPGIVHMLMAGLSKKGWLKKNVQAAGLPGVRVRPMHLDRFTSGRAGPLERWLKSGKKSLTSVEDAFNVYISEAELNSWLGARYKKGTVNRIRDTLKHQGYLHVHLQADPMQTYGQAVIAKLRLSKRIKQRGAAFKGEVGLAMDPRTLWMLDRDLDLDAIKMLLISEMEGYSRAEIEEAFRTQMIGQAEGYTQYLQDLSSMDDEDFSWFVREIKRGAKGQGQYAIVRALETSHLARRVAGKRFPPLPFIALREQRLLLGAAQGAGEDIFNVFRDIGVPETRAKVIGETFTPLIKSGEAQAAQELIRSFYQLPVQKGGAYIAHMEATVIGLARAMRESAEGATLEETRRSVQRAFENPSKKIGGVAGPGFKGGYTTEFLQRTKMSAPELLGKVFGTTISAMWHGDRKTRLNLIQMVQETHAAASTQDEARRLLGRMRGALTEQEWNELLVSSNIVSTDEAIKDLGADTADRLAREPTPSESTGGMIDDLSRGARKATDKVKSAITEFYESTGGKIAIAGGLALGAYSIIKGMFISDEMSPPPPPMQYRGAPLPPPPIERQPTDRGPRDLPIMGMRPMARIAPTHPAPIPRHGITRTYAGVSPALMGARAANNRDVVFRDETDPMSKYLIQRRMKEISNSDFVR